MTSKFVLQILGTVAGIALAAQSVRALEFTPYLNSTRQGQPKSALGVNFAADALDLRGAITTTKLAGNTTLVTPQLISTFAVIPAINIETKATFTNWNERSTTSGDAVETKLTARSVLPMLAEIEGLVGRNATGEARRKLGLKMNDTTVASFLSKPIQLKANASIEEIGRGNTPSTLMTGVEAALVQQKTPVSTLNRIGFKYTNKTGATEYQRQAATFSRSWAQNSVLRLGVECELAHEATNLQAANLQKAIRFTWQGHF